MFIIGKIVRARVGVVGEGEGGRGRGGWGEYTELYVISA